VEISVSDDGAGLASADPDELFTAGVRDQASTGVGLGLALSRRVARTLGGDVLVTSPSSPTTFTLTMLRF
jgi:signal transduction histidine kinase